MSTLPENRMEGTLPNSFYNASIELITNPNKDAKKRETYRLIALVNRDVKVLKKILANKIHRSKYHTP
jgi:hypothetical protein